MEKEFHKIRIDFEYLKEIYTINSDSYNTLSELKDIVSRKIFPYPGNLYCYYKNIDLSEKEDEEIAKIFPNKAKIKISLKKQQKEKLLKKPNISLDRQPKKVRFETMPDSSTKDSNNSDLKSKTIRKKNGAISLPSININKIKGRQSCNIYNNKIIEQTVNNNIKNNLLINYLNKNNNDRYEKLLNLDKDENEVKNLINKYKGNLSNSLNINKKNFNDITTLISNLKSKNLNKHKLLDNISFNYPKNKILDNQANPILNSEINSSNKKLKKLNISLDDKETKIKNINNNINKSNKTIIDENYLCSSCKKNIISEYCLNCNEFKCKFCIELCKENLHENIKIKLNEDCFKTIMTFGELIISNIDNNLQKISKFDKEIQIYDIKKYRDYLISSINDILNIYNEIMSILENIYKEKPIKKEVNKYKLESNKTKSEINEILQKANSFIKNSENISEPKYKMMNIKYFFNALNVKGKAYNLSTQNIKIYSLNSTINSNMEKCFNEIENIMESMANLDNPFSLKNELNIVYQGLIKKYNNSPKDRKKMLMKRRTIQIKGANLQSFPPRGVDKTPEIIDSKLLEL